MSLAKAEWRNRAQPPWEKEAVARLDEHQTDYDDTKHQIDSWQSTDPDKDWVPDTDDQYIGDADNHPVGVVVGKPTGDPNVQGMNGVFITRDVTPGAGAVVMGYSAEDAEPGDLTSPGTLANAPLEVAGVPVILTGPVFVEVSAPVTAEHYVLLGESTTLADGRHVSPLLMGPQYIPANSEFAEDTRDIPLDGIGTLVDVVTLNVAGTFNAGVSSFMYEIRLQELGGRTVDFDVEVWLNGGFVFRDEFALTGQSQNVSYATPTNITINPGDTLVLRVSAQDTHPQSDGWVNGSVRASRLELRTG